MSYTMACDPRPNATKKQTETIDVNYFNTKKSKIWVN